MDDTTRRELCELYHTARVALDAPSRYERLVWAAREYARKYGVTPVNAYNLANQATQHDPV